MPVCPEPLEQRYGVLGWPLGQSLSPVLHTWALAQRGVRGEYVRWEVPPEGLPAFMGRFRDTPLNGASVTIPHKVAVIEYLDDMTPTARSIGAVNTLYWDNGSLVGHNTDMEGFTSSLASRDLPDLALVLGAGGAARAVLAGLASLGLRGLAVAARDQARAESLLGDFAASFAQAHSVPWDERAGIISRSESVWVINTTPLGMRGKAEEASPLESADLASAPCPSRCLAYDIVYNPLETRFLAMARRTGWACCDGLDMFLGQADAQFHLWTGMRMPLDQARVLLAGCLAG